MKQFKVSVLNCTLLLFVILMFMPSYFSNSIFDMLENLMLVCCILLLLKNKYKPSLFVDFVTVYIAYLVIISFVNKLTTADIHMIISNAKVVVLLAILEFMLMKKTVYVMDRLRLIISILVILDLMSFVFFPEGLYQIQTVWNEWTTTDTAQWIFGNKNNRVYWYIMYMFLTGFHHLRCRTINSKIMCIVSMVISITGIVLSTSSTAMVAVLVAELGMLNIILFLKNRNKINTSIILLVWLVGECLLVFGVTFFLAPIVENVFQKDLTFTGRTTIWANIMVYITQKPVWGWGNINGSVSASLLNNLSFTSAHNQILNTLWQGGLTMFSLLMLLFANVSKRMKSVNNKQFVNMTVLLLMAILIDMYFESILSVSVVWTFLLCCYHLPELEKYLSEDLFNEQWSRKNS